MVQHTPLSTTQKQILAELQSDDNPGTKEVDLQTLQNQFGDCIYQEIDYLTEQGLVEREEKRKGVRITHYCQITEQGKEMLRQIDPGPITAPPGLVVPELPAEGYVFISYSRRDKDILQTILNGLNQANIPYWVDLERLTVGIHWQSALEAAVSNASGLILLMSPSAKDSLWVMNEITVAQNKNLHIFPLLIRGDNKQSIPFAVSSFQYIDLRDLYENGMQDLIKTISNFLNVNER